MQVWQIAGGEPRRNFSDIFLRHDVMFLGPGRFGPYETPHYTELVRSGIEKDSQIRQVRHFIEHPSPGDVVLLRLGNRVKALGLIPDDGYFWSDTFDDIYGWDLQHARRVLWQDHLTAELEVMQEQTGFYAGVNLMPTFTAINKPEYLDRMAPLLSQCKSRKLRNLPTAPPPPLSIEALGHELFTRGIPNDLVDAVLVAIQHQRRLAHWYQTHGRAVGRPKEHEVVAYMILPLLLALGWSEQLLAIEWNRVDLSAFWGTPTDTEHCSLICEAKGIGHPLESVLNQAIRYVRNIPLKECRKILLADGMRLYLYERQDGSWPIEPVGYLNINLLRTQHIAPAGTNAVDTIVALTPAGVARPMRTGKGKA